MTRRVLTAAVALGVLSGGLTACSSEPGPGPTARAYLAAWSAGTLQRAAAATDDPAAATKALQDVRDRLQVTAVRAQATKVSTQGDRATVTFQAKLVLRALGDWEYTGRLALVKAKVGWQVHWAPADIYPQLTGGRVLARTRALPERAAILDASGQPLFTPTEVVTVGVEPARVTDASLAALRAATAIDVTRARKLVDAASPHAFVPLITLRRSDYDRVRSAIHDLPGVVFHTGTEQLAPTSDFGRAVLGRVGEATAEVLKDAGDGYEAGDHLGLYGLQRAFQQRLAGAASGTVELRDADGTTVATLARFTGTPGQPVRTTLDRDMQAAAERALAAAGKPAALVAVRPSDGAVLAVADTPADSSFDRALVGRYPPGSTFKVVTSYALLQHGATPDTPVPCPPQATVGGRAFHNFEGEHAGVASFATDFVISCNTAFVQASSRLGDGDLTAAASTFGIGGQWSMALPAYAGSVPRPGDAAEKAADAIGQGKVLVSPLGMAMVAAAVQSGTWRPPVLVTEPSVDTGAEPQQLDAATVRTLQQLMGRVVSEGTAAGAGLPSGTAGKTGTAEFGTDNPPQTHAWFIGYRGDLAFAVLVEGGGVGGRAAAPIAAAFLKEVGG